jgi:DNA-binding response OmpR family regulator
MINRVLIIEDDPALQEYLKEFLREQGYSPKVESRGADALVSIEKSPPNLVLLDLNLPDVSGESVCIQIRKIYPDLPIIILTAKANVEDRIKGLNLGADDYVTKPFNGDELLARIKARMRSQTNENMLTVGDLTLDPKTIEVKRAGKEISLTPQEFKLLEYLMQNKGIVLSRESILNRIWLYSPDIESRVVDVYMGYLRKKIDKDFKKKLINSVRGFGYTIKD